MKRVSSFILELYYLVLLTLKYVVIKLIIRQWVTTVQTELILYPGGGRMEIEIKLTSP